MTGNVQLAACNVLQLQRAAGLAPPEPGRRCGSLAFGVVSDARIIGQAYEHVNR
jgi:hypothetical protein